MSNRELELDSLWELRTGLGGLVSSITKTEGAEPDFTPTFALVLGVREDGTLKAVSIFPPDGPVNITVPYIASVLNGYVQSIAQTGIAMPHEGSHTERGGTDG